LRHVLIGFLGIAVGVSTVGSIINTLDFNKDDPAQAAANATPTSKARVTSFRLTSASQTDASAGAPIEVVGGQDVSFSAQVEGVRQLLLVVSPSSGDAFNVTAQPDAQGNVSAGMRLPEANTVYVVQAYGYIKDKLIAGWQGGYINNRPAVIADNTIRVIVRRP
jgi:hypothetical protein